VTLRGNSAGLAVYRETLERIVEQVQEMSRLVDDLLTLARSESDDITFEDVPVDIGQMAAEALREAAILGRPRGIRIDAAIDPDLVVDGDPQRMKQVLMIVLDNAVKYSERDSVVRLEASADDRGALLVIRNPYAVDDDELPRLFDRFYRGRDAATLTSAGSGLGLAIAKWIVEKQGGDIALRRQGADSIEVVIRFPLAEARGAIAVPPARVTAGATR
jgi:signal transduction histidine kinase